MVCAPSSLLVVAALAALCVDATPINSNPVTMTGTISLLNKRNPAYGGPPSREMVQPVVVGNEPTLSIAETYAEAARRGNNTDGRRKLEATSADVQKLNDYFNTGMDTNVNSIYQKYSSGEFNPPPWPSSYWPTYLDSINYRWTNEISPAEKYARAYGRDVNQFMNSVSSSLGVDSQADGNRVCTSNSQCARFNDGSSCAKRYGSSSGYCVPTWYGICHAWAPAAILEDEPRCNVVKNGVTFHPFDIKALLTAIYDGADVPIVFTGARYDGGGSPLDEYGRYTDPFERDLGAGYFHIAVTNIMGRFGKSFVVDVNADAQVWNQPVRGFNTDKPVIMSPSQAAKTYFNVPVYPFNDQAKSIAYMHMAFRYINEYIQDGPLVSTGVVDKATVQRDYYYLLELDANQNIIGGEWLYGSRTNHPDFLWFATGKPSDSASPLGISYHEVSDLLRQSTACGDPITPTPTPPPGPSGDCGNDQTGPQACPSGQYCQPWNPAFYQCRTLDAKCGKQETGVDYYGDDLATHQLLLPEQCCDKCYETAGCTGYTFVNYNPDGKAYCYLKKGPGSRQSKVGVVSATITTTPTPPPGPSDQCGNDQVGPQACPSGQYCQPWNPAFYQCRTLDAKCGKQETGVDYYGDDLATHQLLLPEQCCDKCYETAGCTGYTFVNYNPDGKAYCYLKKGAGTKQKKVGVVSASITTPSTPPPGPSDQCGNDQVGPQPCPSGQYCQPWNPAFYQCRSLDAKCGKQEVAVDYYGDDIATFQLLLPEDCCDKCYATAGCKAYTFVNYNADGKAYCYLKKGTGTKQKKVGVVSAAITSPTEPASGAQCGDDTTGPQPCATGEYCQPWNPTFYQCRKLDAKCGKQEVAVDYYGDDIATFQLLLPEDCCDKCIATTGCKAYTFVNYNPDGKAYCYLKKGTGTKQKKVGVVSAVIQ